MRAREPDVAGFAVRDGVRIAYEIFGEGESTMLFMPAWSIVHSRMWKAQVPYFSRHGRVVTFDGRGNGRSDKAPDLDYSDDAYARDALAVLDATNTTRATVVGLSAGARWALLLATRHPERVERLIFIAPAVPLGAGASQRSVLAQFHEKRDSYSEWEKFNRHYWHEDYRDFVEFFFSQALPEAHSTKQLEDCVEWAQETTPETLVQTAISPRLSEAETIDLARRVSCPVLVLHGDDDRIASHKSGKALAELTGGTFESLPNVGHLPQARYPVRVNLAIRDAIRGEARPRAVKRRKKKRALFISSPIGLGHAQRDIAIAAQFRTLVPDVEIDWLAQSPVTVCLAERGERVHPASAGLANESSHFESECAGHDLHAFQAIRRMDEILVNNYMVLNDLLEDEDYDIVVGDEAWDVDYYLHEHPHQKKTAFAWMTDFVGWIPMPDGGAYEARIAADYNEEMIGHIDRHPNVRDRSIFVGDPDDIVTLKFGDHLPFIRDWTQQHYDFAGYVTGFTPPGPDERAALRERFGYRDDEVVCIVTVGGSGVGAPLLRKILDAYPEIRRRVQNLRMIVVAGPRIDPESLPRNTEIEIHAYVPELYRRLSACDIALVQGGLTTTMELTAAQRPFIYFPLRHHFEQNVHVRHRLQRYNAGRCMLFDEATPESIADAVASELKHTPAYQPVAFDGAAKAASLIAALI